MKHEHDEDVVRVYAGPLVNVELYQQVLKEAGIDSKVVGLSLTANFGTALPNSVELWVRSEDVEKANAAIELYEKEARPSEEAPTT